MRIVWVLERTDQLWGGVKVALTDANWLQLQGHEVTVVSRTGKPDWMDVRCAFVTVPDLAPRSLPPADVYVGTFWTTVPAAAAAAALHGAAAVHFCQGYEGLTPEFAPHKHRIEAVYRLPGVQHVTISAHLTRILRDLFDVRAHEIPNAIDHDVHYPAAPSIPRKGRVRVGLVGPYQIPLKGIRAGIDACRLAAAAGLDVELVRVSNTGRHAEESDLPFPVEWHERVRPERMGEIYRSLDVFLGTSNAIEEGFSLPAVEAMACGIPCVLTDIPCFRAHGDGQYALFVPPDDAAGMAEAMVLASRVGEIRSALRTAGLEAAARYTLDGHGEALLAALEQAVAQARGATPRIRDAKSAANAEPTTTDTDFAPVVRLLGELRSAAALARKLGHLADAARLESAAACLDRDGDDIAAASAHARTRGGLPDVGLDDPVAAAQSLRAAIAAGARSADVYNRLGVALFAQGDLDGAKHSFQRALLLDPGHRDAKDNLAELTSA